MQKITNVLHAQVINKALTMSKHKGVYEAKRMMMRAGLPVDTINNVLLPVATIEKKTSTISQ